MTRTRIFLEINPIIFDFSFKRTKKNISSFRTKITLFEKRFKKSKYENIIYFDLKTALQLGLIKKVS